MADTFLMLVMDRLRAEGQSGVLTPAEVDLCQMAVDCGVGPGDTACQLMANRQDAE